MNTARIDLHLHLDGSIDLKWGYKTALKRGVISPDFTFDDYYNVMYRRNFKSREEGFKKFDFTCDVMQYPEDLHDCTYNLVETLAKQGLIYAEIRFASQQHTKVGLTQKEALKAVIDGAKDGMKDYPTIKIGIINAFMHKGADANSNYDLNVETLKATKAYLGEGAVGLDLAGYENNGDFRLYKPLFDMAKAEGIPYTIHAGEMEIGAHVLDALDFGAYRIGHGIDSVQSPEYLKAIVDAQIPLEICFVGNCRHDRFNYSNHPIHKLIEAGAVITSNTDNMMFAQTNLAYDHAMLKMVGITDQQLMSFSYNAVEAAFTDRDTKNQLKKKLDELYSEK